MLRFQGEMLCYTSEWDGSPQVLFRQRGECHSTMPRCLYACAKSLVCMNLLFTLRISVHIMSSREKCLSDVCVCWGASFESRSKWIIQCVDPVCSSSYLVMRRLETLQSKASPLMSNTGLHWFICLFLFILKERNML